MTPNPLLEAALSYARRGWRVVPLHNDTDENQCTCQEWRDKQRMGPCPTPGKHPRFRKFFDLATIEEKQIRAWWGTMPRANVGIIGGKLSGIWALDTDPRNNGDQSRDSLVFKHGPLPYTMTARTGGGGTHEYFSWPKDFDLPSWLQLDDGLEVIAEGHVIVAAPSYHHVSGRLYAWETELGPDEMLPQEAPLWLLDLLKARLQQAQSPATAAKPREGVKPFPPADVGKILGGCEWMRHCSDDAATLSEPEWYAQLSVLGRCANGEQLAHDLSSPHPEYTSTATAAKLRRAVTDTGPVTCAKVKHSLGGARFCNACPSAGKVKSPVVLGIRAERPGEGAPLGEAPPDLRMPEETQTTAAAPIPIDIEAHVKAVIDADDREAALKLAEQLAAQETDLLAILKQRLRDHFGKRLSIRDLERAIRSKRAKLAAGGGHGGDGGGGDWENRWQSHLIRAGNGAPAANLANAITALRRASEWQGVLWRNEFAECTVARKQPPILAPIGNWTNLHDILTTEWLQRAGIDVSLPITGLAIEAVAHDHKFHPPREYLTALKWDGAFRLDTWLIKYLGAEPDRPPENAYVKIASVLSGRPEEANLKVSSYLESVGAKWMISAVARIFQPGCKADCALVLEGEQGIKKSSALKALGGEWFTDQLEKMGSKDASMQTHGKWIIEISELGSMSKAEVDDVKAFMSRDEERYRPPYAGRLTEVPRQCIFGGTVNPSQYLKDDTGGRRFWPVSCGAINLEALKRDRDQLWAEAKFRYDEGATWWLDVPEVSRAAELEQAARYRIDPWEEKVKGYLYMVEDEVSVSQIMANCLAITLDRWSQTDANRVAAILQVNGWRKVRQVTPTGGRSYVYRPHSPAARLMYAKQGALAEQL